MLFRPRASARHAPQLQVVRWALAASALCGAACTEPTFDAPDADDRGERHDADVSPSSVDAERDADEAEPDAAAARVDAAACADCRSDAGSDASAQTTLDAQVAAVDAQAATIDAQTAPVLDAVRARWAGRYAVRSFVFGNSLLYQASGKYLTLAEIKPTSAGGLELEEEICRFETSLPYWGVTLHFAADYPAGTRLSTPLTFDAQSFGSVPASALIGYGSAPADCAGATTSRSASPVRSWLSGNECECPRDPDSIPISAKDCRVYDSDADGQPGHTFRAIFAGSSGVFRVAQEQRLSLVNGYRVGERLFAQRAFSDVTKVLGCTVDGVATRVADCPLGTDGPCPAEHNPAELVRIEAEYGCRDIIQREQAWFMSQRPQFPAGCPTQ